MRKCVSVIGTHYDDGDPSFPGPELLPSTPSFFCQEIVAPPWKTLGSSCHNYNKGLISLLYEKFISAMNIPSSQIGKLGKDKN